GRGTARRKEPAWRPSYANTAGRSPIEPMPTPVTIRQRSSYSIGSYLRSTAVRPTSPHWRTSRRPPAPPVPDASPRCEAELGQRADTLSHEPGVEVRYPFASRPVL